MVVEYKINKKEKDAAWCLILFLCFFISIQGNTFDRGQNYQKSVLLIRNQFASKM